MADLIERQIAIDAIKTWGLIDGLSEGQAIEILSDENKVPSAQPFHNITMNDVLKYIDGMPEDVWQEFTCCLECRGWELQRRTAKWCGGDFA